MQEDSCHPHINNTASFSRLRSFELNNMGFSLNQISPIAFNAENPQTPENQGTQGRVPTLTPRDRRPPCNTPQDDNPWDQIPDDPAHTNKNCHVPQVGSSYNPDESVVNDHAFQLIQGRFVPPHMTNTPTQQWQQQSSSDEGSGNTTILNGPGDHPNTGAQDPPTGTANSTPQGAAPPALQAPSQTRGPPQAPPVNHQDAATGEEHLHILTNNRIKIQVRIIRVYWITMEPPVDPPAHQRILERVLDPRKAKRSLQNLTLVCLQAQVIHHKRQDHLDI